MRYFILLAAVTFSLFSCTGQENSDAASKQIAEDVSVRTFETLIAEGNGFLLDVRTPGEYASSHIEGSTLIDVNGSNFKMEVDKLDKTKPVYVYCRSGGRSGSAMRTMKSMGFSEVYNLNGGILAWTKENKAVVK